MLRTKNVTALGHAEKTQRTPAASVEIATFGQSSISLTTDRTAGLRMGQCQRTSPDAQNISLCALAAFKVDFPRFLPLGAKSKQSR